jgi:farnesyl-diphosphate farnesyltransferase
MGTLFAPRSEDGLLSLRRILESVEVFMNMGHDPSNFQAPTGSRLKGLMQSAETRRLLARVSRSFALSLNALPGKVRPQIALAYLLARGTDTIADVGGLESSAKERIGLLEGIADCLHRPLSIPEIGDRVARWGGKVSSRSMSESEGLLLSKLGKLLEHLEQLSPGDRDDTTMVLGRIIEGQIMDLRLFGGARTVGSGVASLKDGGSLEAYTYLVAGCVGEFWTRICVRNLPKYSRVEEETLVRQGVEFGKGLQLVNILRDRGEDLLRGRCYIPAGTSHFEHIDADQINQLSRPWMEKARYYLSAGKKYAASIRGWRARFVVVLPMLIGEKTLDLVEDSGSRFLDEKVKVSRKAVRSLVRRSLTAALFPMIWFSGRSENNTL